MTTSPTSVQHAALQAIDATAAAYLAGCVGVTRAVELGRRNGLDGDQIRERFETAGVGFAEQLAATETGAEG